MNHDPLREPGRSVKRQALVKGVSYMKRVAFLLIPILSVIIAVPGCHFIRKGEGRSSYFYVDASEEELTMLMEEVKAARADGFGVKPWERANVRSWKHGQKTLWFQLLELSPSGDWDGIVSVIYAARSTCHAKHAPWHWASMIPFTLAGEVGPTGKVFLVGVGLIVLPLDIIFAPVAMTALSVRQCQVSDEELRAALDDLCQARRHGLERRRAGNPFLDGKWCLDQIGYLLDCDQVHEIE